jgi:hypothetical protein
MPASFVMIREQTTDPASLPEYGRALRSPPEVTLNAARRLWRVEPS